MPERPGRWIALLAVGATFGLAACSGGCGARGRTPVSTGTGDSNASPVAASGCPLFTADDPWNRDVSGAKVNAAVTAQINAQLGAVKIHPDFGPGFGIPITVVPADQVAVPIRFADYPEESDPGPYPFPGPAAAHVEGTDDPTRCEGDCHLLVVQRGACLLYEAWACRYDKAAGWICGNGARWDLKKSSVGQRPDGWTSADAAGLSIYAGLARYEEVMAGELTHAVRFTLPCTSASHVAPATHHAVPRSCAGKANAPPMGTRVRLKANYDISGFDPVVQVFLRAFKKHGLILADNGSSRSTFYFQSEAHSEWPAALNDLKNVPVSAFEAVEP